MVDAAVAGVMFTVDPVTGRRTETVVDAAPGLGEAVVSGSVDPDHVVLDSATGAVLERRLGGGRDACLTDEHHEGAGCARPGWPRIVERGRPGRRGARHVAPDRGSGGARAVRV
jgi:pyruvate phosphate dikinase-like enzyme